MNLRFDFRMKKKIQAFMSPMRYRKSYKCIEDLRNSYGSMALLNSSGFENVASFLLLTEIMTDDLVFTSVLWFIKIKPERKILMVLLDQNLMLFPTGAFVFAVSLTLCTGKWIKLLTETVLAFNLHFQHIELSLKENQVHHSKQREMLV